MPDAWDDDWVGKNGASAAAPDPPLSQAKISKAERRKQQADFNRQIWERENTERPEDNFFLQTQGIVPLKSEFKPQMKVLSRKPAKTSVGTDGAMGQLSLDDDDEDDEDSTKDSLSPEERFQKAQQEKLEKQKAYEERRRQLFGKDEASSTSKPNSKTGSPRNQSRAKTSSESRPASAASNKTRQLFDPNDSVKPEHLRPQRKDPVNGELQPIREPRAPDGSGRGGFGFSPRGGHTM